MIANRSALAFLLLFVMVLSACGRGANTALPSPAEDPCRDPQLLELHDRRYSLTLEEERVYTQLDFLCRAHRARGIPVESGLSPEVIQQETMPWVMGVLFSIGFFYVFTGTTGT